MNVLASLVVVVWGEIYERYADELEASAREWFLPGESEIVRLEGAAGWPEASACRYRRLLEEAPRLRGEWVFQVDADARFEGPVGREILAEGIAVTTHPGFPPEDPPSHNPYERNPSSSAHVASGEGGQYHPGAFVGAPRETMLELAGAVEHLRARDEASGFAQPDGRPLALWYDESYLNRVLLSEPWRPALVLPGDYCYWDFWGPAPGPRGERRLLVHLDKTPAEFAARGLAA